MDLSSPTPTTNSPLIPVFGDNVQDLLNAGALNVNPTGIIVVNSIADTVNDVNSGVTTLRDAINQANGDTGEDLIVFERSLFSNQQTITLSGTELDITHNLDIIAPRDTLTGGDLVTVSGNKASRVLEIGGNATVTVSGLIVADGSVIGDDGGGIKNSGILNVSNCTISNNNSALISGSGGNGLGISNNGILTVNNSTISGNIPSSGTVMGVSANFLVRNGGGIYNNGTATVSNSTISGNDVFYGGGIYNNGTATVSNSTISGNKAFSITRGAGGFGGGIYNSKSGILTVSTSTINSNSASLGLGIGGGIINEGNLVVSNSTISGNYSAINGGGISNSGNLTLLFSTLALNTAVLGGGVFNVGSANVRNTIISDVISSSSIFGRTDDDTFRGTFTSSGYNLIGNISNSTGFDATGDIVGTSLNPIDLKLAPLDFNGGPTQTLALLPDSPAIDAGDPTVLDTDPTTDQRGLPRVSNGRADIGAFEVQV